MTRSRITAYRFRRVILVVGIIYVMAGVLWVILPYFNESELMGNLFSGEDGSGGYGLMGTPLSLGNLVEPTEFNYGVILVIVTGFMLLAQWAFLRPGRGWTVRTTTIGRPLRSAIFAAAFMAMMLTIAFFALLLEIPNWWEPVMGGAHEEGIADGLGIVGVWTAMLILWCLWAWVFFIYWRQGDRYTQMGKMIRGLVAGSLLEVFIAVPVHVWAVRQRECYCCRGTYTTLIFAGAVLLFAFGPGIILLYMREKYRRGKLLYGQHVECHKCGYDLRGTITEGVDKCSECGADISIQKAAYTINK